MPSLFALYHIEGFDTLFGINSPDVKVQLFTRCIALAIATPVLLLAFRNGRQRGDDPFSRSTITEPKPYIFDKTERNKVIKAGYSSQIVDDAIKENGGDFEESVAL